MLVTGLVFDHVEITLPEESLELYPDQELQKFLWCKFQGTVDLDDYGTATDGTLIAFEHALGLLREIGIAHAGVTEFQIGNGRYAEFAGGIWDPSADGGHGKGLLWPS